nr:MAG TPA: Photosystem II protein D1 [Caudoviricetes sp.]DAV04932.1 MAG TPA: Photosystem II protein D1 [Caudoviricetes sp.]
MPEAGGHRERELSRKSTLVGWRSLPIGLVLAVLFFEWCKNTV